MQNTSTDAATCRFDGSRLHANRCEAIVILIAIALATAFSGCQTASNAMAGKNGRPQGGVAQVDRKRWTDVFRLQTRVDKVDVPVWEVPDKKTDVGAIQLAYARWMEKSGNATAAAEAYRKAMQEKPESVEAIVGLARIDFREGRLTSAKQGFDRAIGLEPNNAKVLASFGQFELEQGRVDSAAEKLLRAVEIDPDATHARYSLAVARARQQRWSEARTLFVATVGDAEAHYNMGMLMKDSRPVEAAREFETALSKKPGLKLASAELASLRNSLVRPEILPASHSTSSPQNQK